MIEIIMLLTTVAVILVWLIIRLCSSDSDFAFVENARCIRGFYAMLPAYDDGTVKINTYYGSGVRIKVNDVVVFDGLWEEWISEKNKKKVRKMIADIYSEEIKMQIEFNKQKEKKFEEKLK